MTPVIRETRYVVVFATIAMAVVQFVAILSGATPESAAIRGIAALVGVTVLGMLAQRFLATTIEPPAPSDPPVGSILDLRSDPEDQESGESDG